MASGPRRTSRYRLLRPRPPLPIRAWYHDVLHADWKAPADVKKVYRAVSVVGDNRLVFNIGGNKYRLVISVNYKYRICYVRFIGTHKAYDRIDVATV